jgi:hypothetical protein
VSEREAPPLPGLPVAQRSSPFPSELFLARMNAVADTDVTVVLNCRDRAQRTSALDALRAAAAIPHVRHVGERARRAEPARRHPVRIGSGHFRAPSRIGPIDIAPADDERALLVRWSHLAGDARTCHSFLSLALAPLDATSSDAACRCVELPTGAKRPIVPADVWEVLRRSGVRAWSAVNAGGAAISPLFRPLRPPVGARRSVSARPHSPGGASDAIAVIEIPQPSASAVGSRFVALAGSIAEMVARAGARRVIRVGLTVDVRRHEQLDVAGTAGNLSVIGYVNVHAEKDGAAAHLRAGVRALLRRSFWRQQLAFDSWLAHLPRRAVERGCDVIVRHASRLAPLVVTELWRDDAPRCERCAQPRRRLPAGVTAIVIPPALPPAGLSCGVSLGRDAATIVLRRITPPGVSAVRWLGQLVESVAPSAFDVGPIEW